MVEYKRSLMVCLIETVEFMPLKLELPFDAEKQCELHLVSLHNNSHLKTKVFKLLLQISGLRPVKLIRTDLWTPKKDLLFSTLLMQSKIKMTGLDY